MNLTADVQQILKSAGETTLYRSTIPDGTDVPDELIALFEYSGLPYDIADSAFEQPSLQVVVRSLDFDTGLEKARRISDILRFIGEPEKGADSVRVGSTYYFRFAALQPPFKLKEDEAGRIYFAQNFRVWARPAE